jgi:antitoxin ParD1/3/4
MPTRNVNLTPELDRAVEERVYSGRYENASEVMRAALRALTQVEQEDARKLAILDQALAQGDASPDFVGDPFEASYRELGWRPRTVGNPPSKSKTRAKAPSKAKRKRG